MWRLGLVVIALVVGGIAYQYYGGPLPSATSVDRLMGQLSRQVGHEVVVGSSPTDKKLARGSWSVVGAPSVSASMLDAILDSCHSPAHGDGQVLYELGVRYGIDPVFAPAFFLHESSCGNAGMAVSTKSLGNIICTPGYSSCIGRFRAYATWEAGFEDWFRLIKEEYVSRGLVTVDAIVPVYAPASDSNDVAAYIAAIKQAVSTWRSGHLVVMS